MKYKRIAITVASLLTSTGVYAQSAGSNVIGVGWLRIMPETSSDPLVVGGQSIPDTGASVDNADTLGLTVTHFFTDHIALETVGGVPPRFKFSGTGALASPAINPLGEVRQWSPALVMKYYFADADAHWRPFVGLGVSYIWFNGAQVNSAFQQALSAQLTRGATTGLSTSAKVNNEWSPVFNGGLTYQFDQHWSVAASVSYLPFGTKAILNTRLPNGGVIKSVAKVTLDPVVTLVSVNYRF